MSATPGYPDRFLGQGPIASLDRRVALVEEQTKHIPELVSNVADLTRVVTTFKGYEAAVKGLFGRGLLLILGAVGSTYGVTRVTAPAPAQERVVYTETNTSALVKACTAMQPGPERDQCAIKILAELMGPRQR